MNFESFKDGEIGQLISELQLALKPDNTTDDLSSCSESSNFFTFRESNSLSSPRNEPERHIADPEELDKFFGIKEKKYSSLNGRIKDMDRAVLRKRNQQLKNRISGLIDSL